MFHDYLDATIPFSTLAPKCDNTPGDKLTV